MGSLKANFNVAIRIDMAVAAALISDSNGIVIAAASKRFPRVDVNVRDAKAALLTVNLAYSYGCNSPLIITLAINKAIIFSDWDFAPIIGDIHQQLQFFKVGPHQRPLVVLIVENIILLNRSFPT